MTEAAPTLQELARPSWSGLVQRGIVGALIRYRVMAFVVGTALLCLFVVVIFQLCGVKMKVEEEIVAPIHGYLYLVYLVTAADLARRRPVEVGKDPGRGGGRLRADPGILRGAPHLPADASRVGSRWHARSARRRDADLGAAGSGQISGRPVATRPGRAPVSSPSRKVVTPDLMVSTYPVAPWSSRLPPAGRSLTTLGLSNCRFS